MQDRNGVTVTHGCVVRMHVLNEFNHEVGRIARIYDDVVMVIFGMYIPDVSFGSRHIEVLPCMPEEVPASRRRSDPYPPKLYCLTCGKFIGFERPGDHLDPPELCCWATVSRHKYLKPRVWPSHLNDNYTSPMCGQKYSRRKATRADYEDIDAGGYWPNIVRMYEDLG